MTVAQAIQQDESRPLDLISAGRPLEPVPPLERRLFTVEDYHRMGEAGVLRPDERVELIDGEVVVMSPVNPPHINAVNASTSVFVRAVGDDAIVSIQNPIRLDNRSEPQPDLALWRPGVYRRAPAGPADTLLALEIAESSAASDRTHKQRIYARAGVREFWLLTLNSSVDETTGETQIDPILEVYRRPRDMHYSEVRFLRRGEQIAPEALPEIMIAVEDLCGDYS